MADSKVNVKACLEEVSASVKKFLLKEGGYDNGYETFVNGEVFMHKNGKLNWNTPKAKQELTEKGKETRAEELYKELQSILIEHEISPILIRSQDVDWGVMKVEVVHIVETKKWVSLY
ncbi:MAG: hypothetical protein R3328_00155 [Planococcaceae bacterium]|nr:hypothetical protein [Planococcaceae bacterium]